MDGSSILTVLLKLAVVFLLVLANGFFVASEFALVSVRRSRIAALIAEGNKRARTVMRVIDHLDAYISATQLGITLASLALGWIGEQTLAEMLTPLFHLVLPSPASAIAAHSIAVAVAFAMITFLHIVLGELAPKTLALERAEAAALAVARPMEIFYRAFKAPIWLLNRSGNMVLRWLGLRSTAEHAAAYSEEELRHLIALSHKSGHLIEDERQLINNVFDFTEATAETVMVPRTEMETLDAELSPAEMLDVFEQTGYSRMPVYRDSLDNIIGIVLQKDLSRVVRSGGSATLEQIVRPPVFVPTSMKLNDALRMLRRSSEHMAIVVDEHGGVEGLVTLEDLLEEIVGDIRDEHDEEAARQIVELPDGAYNVRGNLSIRDANKLLALDLPESDNYHTIAGFMMDRAGKLLKRGDSVDYNGMKLTVQASARNRIVETKIERVKEETPAISSS
ncbi:MAG TPA: hemolysin family protein [Blastocatellia bacterium]|nr:hemolysin family protein [Blastocatellia bacterium]